MPEVRHGATQGPVDQQAILTRRRFLVSLAGLVSGGVFTGCATTESTGQPAQSPAAATSTREIMATEATAVRQIEQLSVDEFLRLSALLTGFEVQDLDPNLGRVYLESLLTRPDPGITLTDLYAQTGFRSAAPPQSLDALAKSGIFEQEQPRTLANKIIEYWYTGLYDTGNGAAVATFTGALAWKALQWTTPPSLCGGAMGSWSDKPRTAT